MTHEAVSCPQNETLDHRGHKTDRLYRCRWRLVMARERLSVRRQEQAARAFRRRRPDPGGVVRLERQGGGPPDLRLQRRAARRRVGSTRSCATSPAPSCHPRSAGSGAPCDAGATRSSPGTDPTSATARPRRPTISSSASNRLAFGFRRFQHYRIRSLLYAARRTLPAPNHHTAENPKRTSTLGARCPHQSAR
jgi:hypothetical protein